MPRTPFQKFLFGTMMALAMVYGMGVFNASLRQGGLSKACWLIPIDEMFLLCAVVILLETLIAGRLARKLAFRLVGPRNNTPVSGILAVSMIKVCCMCPMMSFVAVILFKGLDGPVLCTWAQTAALNFPMAMAWQLLVAGPLVRLLFQKMFAAGLQPSNP